MRLSKLEIIILLLVCSAFVVFSGQVNAQGQKPAKTGDNRRNGSETETDENTAADEGIKTNEADLERFLLRHNSLHGSTGGIWLVDALSAPKETFRFQLAINLFPSSEELHQSIPAKSNDELLLLGTALSLSWSLSDFLELYGKLGSIQFNREQIGPDLSQDRRDLVFGLKSFYRVAPFWSIGLDLRALFRNPVDDIGLDLEATSLGIRGSSSFDLSRFSPKLPLLVRLNLEYLLDNSAQLLSRVESDRLSALEDAPVDAEREYRHLLTPLERFVFGIDRLDLVSLGLGLELPLKVVENFYLSPLLEWRFGFPVNRQGYDCPFVPSVGSTKEGYENCLAKIGTAAFPHRLGFGVRIVPNVKGVALLLAADFGLNSSSTLVRELQPARQYEFVFALGYAYDLRPVTPIVIQQVVKEKKPEVKRYVRGIVVERATGLPVPNATVHYSKDNFTAQATSDEGRFISYPLEPGEASFEIRHPDYRAGSCSVTVPFEASAFDSQPSREKNGNSAREAKATKASSDQEIFVDLRCQLEAIPRVGNISGQVVDLDGISVADALVLLSGPQEHRLQTDQKGFFSIENMPVGFYQVQVITDGYYVRTLRVAVEFSKTTFTELRMVKCSSKTLVTISQNEIKLYRSIRFDARSATINPKSMALLNELADALLRRPDIKLVEIQGHTDNSDIHEHNLQLSQNRADAIRDWLVQAGIKAERLQAKGYGETRPLLPNLTASNRRRNNRVQFMILERDKPVSGGADP